MDHENGCLVVNYWNYLGQLQRLMDSVAPLQEEIRRMQRLHEQLQPDRAVREAIAELQRRDDLLQKTFTPVLTRDLLSSVTTSQAAFEAAASLMPSQALLKAAIQPIPDLRSFGFDVSQVLQTFERLNAGINGATFLAELDLVDDADDATGEDELVEEAEAKLVELASPETLEALRSVQFEPLRLVDRALRRPEAMLEMDPRAFETFVASLVEQLDFEDVVLTPRANDQGRDILATKRLHGLSILFAFECKRLSPERPVGVAIARALLGTVVHGQTRANKGVLVTTSRFTKGARSFILTEPILDGADFNGIVRWLREYGAKKKAT